MIYFIKVFALCCIIKVVIFLILVIAIYILREIANKDPLFAFYLRSKIVWITIYIRIAWFVYCVVYANFSESFNCEAFHSFVFESDVVGLDSNNVSGSGFLNNCLSYLIPQVFADTGEPLNLTSISPSFQSVQNDSTFGGCVIRQVLTNIITQLGGDLPISLTSTGINAATQLSEILNILSNSQNKGDSNLITFLSESVTYNFSLNFNLSGANIVPFETFTLPVKTRIVPSPNSSGVYGFFLPEENSIKIYLGSALSFQARLFSHISSFSGGRPITYIHNYVTASGEMSNLTWCPLISYPNLVRGWNVNCFNTELSLGASKVLIGFSQFPARVLEQSMINKYSPSLNPINPNVIFFYLSFSSGDFNESQELTTRIQAFDSTMTRVLAQAQFLF